MRVVSSGVKQPVNEANHSHPPSAEAKNAWSCISIPSYICTVWCSKASPLYLISYVSLGLPHGLLSCGFLTKNSDAFLWKNTLHSPPNHFSWPNHLKMRSMKSLTQFSPASTINQYLWPFNFLTVTNAALHMNGHFLVQIKTVIPAISLSNSACSVPYMRLPTPQMLSRHTDQEETVYTMSVQKYKCMMSSG